MVGPHVSDRQRCSPLRAGVAVTLCLASFAIPGCGENSASFPPTLVASTVFEYDAPFSDLDRFHSTIADFTVPSPGTLEITVDWTLPTDDLDLVLSNPACDAVAFAAGACKVLASERSNLKPARLIMTTTATSYRLFVVNLGPERESGTVAVKVTQAQISF